MTTMGRMSDDKRGFGYIGLVVVAALVLATAFGIFTYLSYKERQTRAPSSLPGDSFVDVFGNTIPALSSESAAKLQNGCPRYLILGSEPDITSVRIPEDQSKDGSCIITFTVSNSPQDILALYQSYFEGAGWEELATYSFERPHQRIVMVISPVPGNALAAMVSLQNFYVYDTE